MPQAYVKPGVSVSELVNPSFQPIAGETTDICIIGVGAGFTQQTDIVQLLDDATVELSVDDGIDVSALVVTDYADPSIVYVRGTTVADQDYYITGNTIQRSLASLIPNGATVVVIGANVGGPIQETVVLNGLGATAYSELSEVPASNADTIDDFQIQLAGRITAESSTSVTISDGVFLDTSDPTAITINVVSGSTSLLDTSTQEVYLDFIDTDAVQVTGFAVTLNGTTPVEIDTGGADPAVADDDTVVGLVVRNINDATKNESVAGYEATSDSDALSDSFSGTDVTVVFDDPSTPSSYRIFRSDTPSTIPNGSTVRVSYTATPSDYFLPTRCFSLQDVEAKYGAGLAGDNDPDSFAPGTIKSPVSYAAQLAFLNGAPTVVIQVLYSQSIVNGVTFRFASTDPGTLSDWTTTLEGLRIIEDINLIVPLVATNNVGNGINLSVFQAVQNHIDYMIDQEFQYLQAIFGEDSTYAGTATAADLRDHAKALGARVQSHPEAVSLISPAAYSVANPITGLPFSNGGQYVAAALAGSVASSEIQASLTRHSIAGVTAILDPRIEADKDTDAKAGLMVIESRRGVIQVRHGLTVAVNSGNTREFSVIRAKHYMIESLRETLDDQVVGQIVADSRAAFSVQLLTEAVLEQMVSEGVIVTYDGVTASLSNLDPTTITVGFQYLPAFPLNYVQIQFSINTSTNVVTATDIQS